jgi:S-adenosylmethionine-diacylglycerol 3-amino-3-carboxypropyl transferase
MKSEASANTDFSLLRYAQCWEDADVLLAALEIHPGDVCLSIASAGDNTLAMLTRNPSRVIALDLSRVQLACLELRLAAYRTLSHPELLQFLGSTDASGPERLTLFARCSPLLAPATRGFWNQHPALLTAGLGSAGKFERYFAFFRRYILPLIHTRKDALGLLAGGSLEQRRDFYERTWDTFRWRLVFKIFFSRTVMGRFGRDPAFFKYVQGAVSTRILGRARHALTELNPADNPYLQWIITGRHLTALPLALRPEHFDTIRNNLERLELRPAALEETLDRVGPRAVHRFNLSDIFEYMSEARYHALLARLHAAAVPGGRLAYWNMLAPRSCPAELAHLLRPLSDLAQSLHRQDKAFFYSAFILEEVL